MGYFIALFTGMSVGEIILRIDRHLAKSAAKVARRLFSGHVVRTRVTCN